MANLGGGQAQMNEVLKSRILFLAKILGLAVIYFYSGQFGLSLASVHELSTAVWPGTGLALAVLLLGGRGLWPGVFIGALCVNFSVEGSLWSSLAIATGNTLEALTGAWLVQRFAGGTRAFDRTHTVFRFILLAAMLSTLVSTAFGLTTLAISEGAGAHKTLMIGLTWWLGDMVSNLTLAPLLLLWATWPFPRFRLKDVIEAVGLLFLLIFVGSVVFLGAHPFSENDYPLEYLAIPPLLWASFRFRERGAVTFGFIMSAIALLGSLRGHGPFVRSDENESLLLLQAFMGTITTTALVLASLISERERAEERLQLQDALSRILAEAGTLKEASRDILQVLCEKAGWEVGSIWNVDRADNELVCAEVWHSPAIQIPRFEAVTRQMRFAPGVGLPGRVWASGKAVAVPDVSVDQNFPRAATAKAESLRGGFCFPIKSGDQISGVIECFSRQIRVPDEHFLKMLEAVGAQLGQFLERTRIDDVRRRLAGIVESSEDAIISKNLDDTVTSWNAGAERVFGYTAAEAIGHPVLKLIPAQATDEETKILSRLKNGEIVEHYETVRQRKDGKWINVSLTISPIRDSIGNMIGVSKIARDITQRKKAEAALQRSEALFRQLADAMPQIVWAARPDGYIDYYNQRWYDFTGFAESYGDDSWGPILHPDDLERCRQTYFQCIRDERQYEIEYRFKDRATGGYRWFLGRALPVRDEGGKIIRWFGTCTDIDEQKQAEQALAEAQEVLRDHADTLEKRVAERTAKLQETIQSLDSVCYSIAHDLRAPLRAVGGFSRELESDYSSKLDGMGREYLHRIRDAATRMDQLILDLLELGRLNTVELSLGRVELKPLIHKALLPLEQSIKARGAQVTIREPLLPVRGSTVIVEQVLANLIGNGLKFVQREASPRLEIWTERHNSKVRLWVRDNGIGMKADHVKKIFQPFVRLVNGADYPGTGIGLAIVRKGAERMGGHVGVESELGKGSRFWVELPAADPE
jgi:PAS domain S-box-containing protein